ncbi:Spy/CpxP family protein refolding chaperone [Gloeobacter kilaueensis]|uniref:P pilus assembly/Cpx signaling pathway, periplasmic inhibitor/zinc-resistance associated protein n=1 Tax=Gloeobacter kilaueensis (strain ATCC BAA-2537 / CCAP 1431/1 / ULC 316 / JS1) TaxID=1183438 RepID=U5QK02_GLOK1|nr:Spy/CpxP family protein refolding chaperone [Gloeobacter kilaueensis]AGY59256.1 hypothetical protein GKIL_3010 [Gloeobacter kilaueensis JS1]
MCNFKLLLLVTLSWCSSFALAFAQTPPESLDLRGLNLTPDQRSQLQDIRREDQQSAAPIRDGLNTQLNQLRDLYTSDAPDEQVRSQYDRMQVYRQRLERARFDNLMHIRGVLTLEQRAQLRSQFGQRRRTNFSFARP